MSGPVQQMTAAPGRAGMVLHALELAGALIHTRATLASNEHGRHIGRAARKQLQCQAVLAPFDAAIPLPAPPWKPVRLYSVLYTARSASGSQVWAALSVAEGISGATVSAIPCPRAMM